jgi:hypothetical protein
MGAAETNNDLGLGGNKQGGTEVKNGLVTPEATPAVEDGRVVADKARQAAEAAAETSANGQDLTETANNSGDESDGDLSDYETDSDGDVVPILPEDEMDGVTETDEIPLPSKIIRNVYEEATQFLAMLMVKSDNLDALRGLTTLNEKIKQQNEKEENPPDGWTIDVPFFASSFEVARPYYDRLLKRPEGTPVDEEAKEKLEEINNRLREKGAKHHFPANWVISPPTEEDVAKAQAAKRESVEILTQRKAEKKAKKDKKKVDDEAAAVAAAAKKKVDDEAAAVAAGAKKKVDDEAAGVAAAAKKKVDDEAAAVAAAAAAKKFGNIEFPWVTYPLPTGERIIAGRKRTKDDVAGSLCCVELPCTDPTDPTFEFRDDIDIFELQKYFETPGIKLMGETDEKGRPVKVWRKVDRKDFRQFLFCVVGKRERSDLRKRTTPVCPEVLCGVVMADGVTVLNKTGLLNMVGKKAEEGYIRRYCEKKGITSPWDVKPNSWTIATEDKELLDKLKSERLNSALSGNSESKTEKTDTKENINTSGSSLDSTLKKMEERMASMETKENINTSGSSLDSTLKKMEERMASMETKLAKVDELDINVANITLLIQQLMKQAGLNATGG